MFILCLHIDIGGRIRQKRRGAPSTLDLNYIGNHEYWRSLAWIDQMLKSDKNMRQEGNLYVLAKLLSLMKEKTFITSSNVRSYGDQWINGNHKNLRQDYESWLKKYWHKDLTDVFPDIATKVQQLKNGKNGKNGKSTRTRNTTSNNQRAS